ncbi:hypothetical protein UPYG_G00010390 [Umbra pygmaea]|uniref:Uncharacterized protein n=1 Tax=Umbra pygmaea TaxID=75934 RepID=A0ABD0Y5S7_UMBPY
MRLCQSNFARPVSIADSAPRERTDTLPAAAVPHGPPPQPITAPQRIIIPPTGRLPDSHPLDQPIRGGNGAESGVGPVLLYSRSNAGESSRHTTPPHCRSTPHPPALSRCPDTRGYWMGRLPNYQHHASLARTGCCLTCKGRL